jgi:hypothetical protein
MQKVLDILEKNVEWIALGLGVLFLGWMSWSYAINSPVSKTIGPDTLTPGNVDAHFLPSAERLEDAMRSTNVPAFPVVDFTPYVQASLDLKLDQPQQLAATTWDYQPAQPSAAIVMGPSSATGSPVAMLPTLPAAKPVMVLTGQSSVTVAPPAAPAAASAAPAPAPAAAQPAADNRLDKHWATIVFSVPMADLNAQWTKAFGPDKAGALWKLTPGQRSTKFLAVVAYRNEKQPDGTWGPDVEVQRLDNDVLNPYPAAGDMAAELQYDVWAGAHAMDIAAPRFFDPAPPPSGTIWKDPQAALQAAIAPPAAAAGAPAAAQQPAAAVPAAMNAPVSTDPNVILVQPLPTTPQAPPMGTIDPCAPPTPPNTVNPDLLVYLTDDTVVPGKTYRYHLAYKLRNPLFNLPPERAANRKWIEQFDLASPVSDDTPEVSIDLQTSFFCAANGGTSPATSFLFDVFTWANGLWQKHQFTVKPGDEIGGVADGINYATGYTFLMAKNEAHSQQYLVVVVSDETGESLVRNADLDFNSQDHKAKQQLVDAAKSAPAGGAPGAPQGAPGAPAGQQAPPGVDQGDNN